MCPDRRHDDPDRSGGGGEGDDDGWTPRLDPAGALLTRVLPEIRRVSERTGRRTAVFTAEFGGYDDLSGTHPPVAPHVGRPSDDETPDVFVVTDSPSFSAEGVHALRVSADEVVASVPGLAERVEAAGIPSDARGAPANRVVKILTPLLLSAAGAASYDVTVYIDANAQLNAPIRVLRRKLADHDFLMLRHPQRDCALAELDAIRDMRRCPAEAADFGRMRARLRDRWGLPEHAGLMSGYLIVSSARSSAALAFRLAWMREYTHFWRDQPAFMAAFAAAGARFVTTAAPPPSPSPPPPPLSAAAGPTIRSLPCEPCERDDPELPEVDGRWPLAVDVRFREANRNMRRHIGRPAVHNWQRRKATCTTLSAASPSPSPDENAKKKSKRASASSSISERGAPNKKARTDALFETSILGSRVKCAADFAYPKDGGATPPSKRRRLPRPAHAQGDGCGGANLFGGGDGPPDNDRGADREKGEGAAAADAPDSFSAESGSKTVEEERRTTTTADLSGYFCDALLRRFIGSCSLGSHARGGFPERCPMVPPL